MDLNSLIQVVLPLAGGAIIWQVLQLIYNYFKIGSMTKKGAFILGNYAGYNYYKGVINHIKDQKLKDQVIADADASGDQFDEGWDQGLRGKKLY